MLFAPTFSFPGSYILFKHLRSWSLFVTVCCVLCQAASILKSSTAFSLESVILPRTISKVVDSMATDWQSEYIIPQNQPTLEGVGAHSNRALRNTSGNAQSYSDSIGNSNPPGREEHLQHLGYKYTYPPVPFNPQPVPAPVRYCDPQIYHRLQQRKIRRQHSVGPNASSSRRGRSYLNSQKYLEYRARPRRDTGKDGEPVWSDQLEDAFQKGEISRI